jgi:hypothetical protein
MKGFHSITETQWSGVARGLGLAVAADTVFNLKFQYSRYLFPYEKTAIAQKEAASHEPYQRRAPQQQSRELHDAPAAAKVSTAVFYAILAFKH